MPVMDADEARFAQATRQMVETGDYVRIRLQDDERNRKPIGIHWLQAAAVNAIEPLTRATQRRSGPTACLRRSGSCSRRWRRLWAGAALLGRRAALLRRGAVRAGMLAGFEGMTAKTDAVLLGFTTLAMAALARLRVGSRRRTRSGSRTGVLFWFALGCGVLIKGPVTPLVAALTLGALALVGAARGMDEAAAFGGRARCSRR